MTKNSDIILYRNGQYICSFSKNEAKNHGIKIYLKNNVVATITIDYSFSQPIVSFTDNKKNSIVKPGDCNISWSPYYSTMCIMAPRQISFLLCKHDFEIKELENYFKIDIKNHLSL